MTTGSQTCGLTHPNVLESVIYGFDFIFRAKWNALAQNGGVFTHFFGQIPTLPYPLLRGDCGAYKCRVHYRNKNYNDIAYGLLVEFKHLTTVMKAAIVNVDREES